MPNFGRGKLGVTEIKGAQALAVGTSAAAEEPTRNLRRDLNFFLEVIMGIISYFLGKQVAPLSTGGCSARLQKHLASRITELSTHSQLRN